MTDVIGQMSLNTIKLAASDETKEVSGTRHPRVIQTIFSISISIVFGIRPINSEQKALEKQLDDTLGVWMSRLNLNTTLLDYNGGYSLSNAIGRVFDEVTLNKTILNLLRRNCGFLGYRNLISLWLLVGEYL